jgi:putative phosphoribosyl transferase
VRRFRDRSDAGRQLAERLAGYAGRSDVVVLALPRGGAPVAFEVSQALGAPLEVFVVRKLGVPGHEELAFGAVATGGARVLNDEVVARLGIGAETIERITDVQREEVERREQSYRDNRPPPRLDGKTVVLVDDGLATGATMRAAVAAVRQHQPGRVIVAVPTGSPDTCRELERDADEVVCLINPDPFLAVGFWYDDFSQTSDEEVRELLARASEVPAERG